MQLSSRIVHLNITVNEDESLPSSTLMMLLCCLQMWMGQLDWLSTIMTHGMPDNFENNEHITEGPKLVGTTKWIRTQMGIDLRRPRMELVLITEKLQEDKALQEGKEYEYIHIENVEPIPHSTSMKEDVLSPVATFIGNIKKLPSEDLKHVLYTITHEIEERRMH